MVYNNNDNNNNNGKTRGGYRTKGAKDKQKRCTRGHRRFKMTGECKPSYYFMKDDGVDNTLFTNKLIIELSKMADVKLILKSKNIMFQTLSQFTKGKNINKYTDYQEDKLFRKIGSICGEDVSYSYIEKSLSEVIVDEPNPYMDILFIKNKKQKILGFLIAELGECNMRPNTYVVKLICSESGLGKLLLGACLFCIKYNEDVSTKACILELAHSYRNMPGFFMYTKMGFNVDNSLIGNSCFYDAIQMPMSLKLSDKYTKQHIVNAITRPDFKQIDVHDTTGIYELGLPLKEFEDKGKSFAIQEKLLLIANILRKFKVYSKNDRYRNASTRLLPVDELRYVKNMKFIKSNNIPVESQHIFRKFLHDNHSTEDKFLHELEKEFAEVKKEYIESKRNK
jgi:hypothetical protein